MINEEKLFKLIDKNTNTAEIKTVYKFIIKINSISINQIQKEFNMIKSLRQTDNRFLKNIKK